MSQFSLSVETYILFLFCYFSKYLIRKPNLDYSEEGKKIICLIFLLFVYFVLGCRFSSGIELANLVVSSGLLKLSWDKISELYTELNQSEEIRWKVYQQPQSNCIIVAFVVSPNCTKQLLEEEELVPSSSLPFFHFLRTEINSSFSISKAAVTLFDSILDQLSSFKDRVPLCLFLERLSFLPFFYFSKMG